VRAFFLLLVLWCAALRAFADDPAPVARHGLIDLTAPGAMARAHELQGEWGFAWARFLDPESDAPPPAFAPVPAVWNALTADGKPPGTDGFGTYTLRILCPVGQQLALSVSPQRTAMRLYINGRLVAAQGTPATTQEEAQPAIGRRAVLTESFACPLRVTLHLSNWSHRAGGV